MLRRLDLRGRADNEVLVLPRPELGEGPVGQVRSILADVQERGDDALREITERIDGVVLDNLRVDDEQIDKAMTRIPIDLSIALRNAAEVIERFHRGRRPLPRVYEQDGIVVTDLVIPVARVGVYVPAGRATYPSSLLMTAIPARVAGVGSIICCSPPVQDGEVPATILAASAIAGVDELYRVGGAQAIGAMAYGTKSIGRVDVVVGPGSKWVSIAKREVSGIVATPAGYAGPSEVVVVADETTPVEFAAIDIIVQAEHGPDGFSWLVTWSEKAAEEISECVERFVERSPRREDTKAALEAGGYVVLVDGPQQALEIVNEIAPEHLELTVADAESLVPLVRNAGAVFLGPLAPASIGDYIAGPSHVLPTFGSARFASGLGVEDFVRHSHTIAVDERGIERVAKHVATIAESEQLPAHAESVRVRMGNPSWSSR
jgi:histidinol dehydrogenase